MVYKRKFAWYSLGIPLHKTYHTSWKIETMDGPLTSSGPKKPDSSILNAFKPAMVLLALLVLFFAAMYFLG